MSNAISVVKSLTLPALLLAALFLSACDLLDPKLECHRRAPDTLVLGGDTAFHLTIHRSDSVCVRR
jgi:hypothetical protein